MNEPAAILLKRSVETTNQPVWTAQGAMMSISSETSLRRFDLGNTEWRAR